MLMKKKINLGTGRSSCIIWVIGCVCCGIFNNWFYVCIYSTFKCILYISLNFNFKFKSYSYIE